MTDEKKNGRPSKFTPERIKNILKSINNRIPYVLAAEANGICEETFYAWMRKGFEDLEEGIESDFANFSESIKKIEEERIRQHLEKLENNVERWQSDAWILERRWAKLFGQNFQLMEMDARLKRLEKDAKNG